MTGTPASIEKRLEVLSSEQAALLELLVGRTPDGIPELRPRSRDENNPQNGLPASWAQQSLWFIDQLEGGGAAYNIPVVLEVRGRLDRLALMRSLEAFVQRHEVLRAVFVNLEGELKLRIAPQNSFELKIVELAGLTREQQEAEVQREKFAEAQERFDLGVGPPIRARLLCLGPIEHVLLITMHHIASDGWSIGVMMRELSELYAADRENRKAALSPLLVQYPDYAHWQRQCLSGRALEKQLNYWRAALEGAPPELELPTDWRRPAVQRFHGQRTNVEIDPVLSADIRACARRHGVTTFVLLLAGWSIVLSRLSGQDDIVIGTPVANRSRPELEGLIGLFVNALALRVRLPGEAVLSEYLAHVQKVTLAAFDHQDTPFDQVVESLRPQRSLNRHPLFQVMFVLHNATRVQWSWPGLTVRTADSTNETAKFDLLLSLEEHGEQIAGSINWNADLFERSTVERWMECFELILREIVTERYTRIEQLPILTERERRQVIESFNATLAPFPQYSLIHELFEAQIGRTPELAAVVHGSQMLTYAELNARANQVAHFLNRKGVLPDQRVGLYFERSLEMVVGILGTLKAGGGYLPLDPSYPSERVNYMLRDSRPRIVLTQRHLLHKLGVSAIETIALDDECNGIAAESTANLASVYSAGQSNQLAYVIYTSGSTGQPKGVMIEHYNVVGLWHGLESFYRKFAWCQRIAVNASFNFDASVKQFIQLLSGRTLVLLPEEYRWDASQLLGYMNEQQVNGVDCTPSQLRTWIEAGLLEMTQSSLRLVLIGGEPIDPELWQRASDSSSISFLNVYGPTECTVDATAIRLHAAAAPSIGPPMENRRVYILDEYRRPLPVGVLGEIYIGGGGVGRGYLDRPELTSERFQADHFSMDPGARLYRTGDFGRWRGNGTIEYGGRNDDQLKIRGYRIEGSEIEACLTSDVRIKEAAVIAREHVPGDIRLVAYVTLRDGLSATPTEIRTKVKTTLPDYMVPSAFVILEHMPLTPSGKLDRRALPAPEPSAYDRAEYESPEGDVERALAGIWQLLLQNEHIGRRDNFFDLGGHSLLAVKALFHINQSFDSALKVTDLYRSPTIQELAACIAGRRAADQLVELSREAALDDGLLALPGPLRAPARAIFLTGATGFVGRFLLTRLLRDTEATIYCLVRAISPEIATSRLSTTLQHWGLWREQFAARIVAICGDVSAPRLGIENATYEMLCEQVDSIYHCATSMNHLETYSMAKPANVGAVTELLKIATSRRPKLINHVSTLSIFSSHGIEANRVVDESSSIDHERHFTSDGYVASKWVSEKMFLLAASRGIPCNLFRLGLVWADSEQGRYDELQRGYRVFKSSLLCGYGIKNYRFESPPLPVDHVTRAIVSLATEHKVGKGIFHITAAGPPIDNVFERCNEIADTGLELIPYYDWIQHVKRLHERGQSLPVVPLVEFAFSMSKEEFHASRQQRAITRISAERTHRELERASEVFRVVRDDLLKTCLDGMLRWDAQLREPEVLEKYTLPPSQTHDA